MTWKTLSSEEIADIIAEYKTEQTMTTAITGGSYSNRSPMITKGTREHTCPENELEAPREQSPVSSIETGGVIFRRWQRITERVKQALLTCILTAGMIAAKNPIRTICVCIVLSLSLAVIGLFTNFTIETDGDILWTPSNALSLKYGNWVKSEESGFPESPRRMRVILHREGSNVLGVEGFTRLFDVVDEILSSDGYEDLCGTTGVNCPLSSATNFYGSDRNLFDEANLQTDAEAIRVLSGLRFLDGSPVDRGATYGKSLPDFPKSITTTNPPVDEVLMDSAKSYLVDLEIPPVKEDALPYEEAVTDNLFTLQQAWDESSTNNKFRIEINTERSFDDELLRGIEKDIPLMVVAFIIMGVFCAITLGKCHPVRSQSLLGLGAVCTIMLSLLTGYGLLFIIGTPFSSLTQIFPYVMVGVGLDDTFILTGSFARTDKNKDVIKRVEDCLREVGVSISLSTLTTVVAFCLGCFATLPGIQWFCLYAAPTVMIDFIYQITFFMAILVLDARRMKKNKYDCCVCFTRSSTDDACWVCSRGPEDDDEARTAAGTEVGTIVRADEEEGRTGAKEKDEQAPEVGDEEEKKEEDNNGPNKPQEENLHDDDREQTREQRRKKKDFDGMRDEDEELDFRDTILSRAMEWYGEILLDPIMKVTILVFFSVLLAMGIVAAASQKQEFDFRDLTPPDSFVRTFYEAVDQYASRQSDNTFIGGVYFRNVDVSDPLVQDQMVSYVDDLVGLPFISFEPSFFWVKDFQLYVDEAGIQNESFPDQIQSFLSTPPYDDLYQDEIILAEDGTVTASRTFVTYDQVTGYNTQSQIDALFALKDVSDAQRINSGEAEPNYPFFVWGQIHYAWELYAAIVYEILLTVILGLVSVFLITLIFVPHPIGSVIVTPVVTIIYVELLGVLRIANLYINSVTAVGLIMCIGLVVDYNIHVVLAYFETDASLTRNERVKVVLKNIGKSVLLGGVSTLLGVLPLAFSSSEVFRTFFVTFLGIVFLGTGHGLVFTPVVLSLIGPRFTMSLSGSSFELEEDDFGEDAAAAGEDSDETPPARHPPREITRDPLEVSAMSTSTR